MFIRQQQPSRPTPRLPTSTRPRLWPNSTITIRVSREDFTTFAAKDVRVVLDPPAASGDSLDRDTKRQPDGTWTINDITLAPPGIWTVRVIVIAQSEETIALDAPIVIER